MKSSVRFILLLSHALLFSNGSNAVQDHPASSIENEPKDTRTLQKTKAAENSKTLSSQLSVYVKEYRFQGNTVFSDEELAEITIPYTAQAIKTEELLELKDKITSHYVNNGFINSGALLPDQDIEDGVIVFQIREGSLEETQLLKTGHLADRYILSRIERGIHQPLNIFELQENLKILEQDSMIESIQATLDPGSEPGYGILSVEVQETDRWESGFEINNHSAASVGLYSAEFYTQAHNLTGWGDSLRVRVGSRFGDDLIFRADENIFYSFYGIVPITRQDTTFSASFSKNLSNIISENFRDLDIQNESYNYNFELRHPVYRTSDRELGLAVKLAHSDTSTTLSGITFPSGSGQPTDRVTTLSFVQDWIHQSQTEVLALYSSVNFGIDFWNATMDEVGNNPDASFVTWLLQGQYLRQLHTWDSRILLKGTLRLSDSEVLPTEKFTLGGALSVRGYRENTFTRDYGALLSFEYRVPVFELKLPQVSRQRGDGQVQLAAFYDYGWAENINEYNDPETIDFLHSVGTGILWQISRDGFAELYWGIPLKSVDYTSEPDIQEAGIHFRIRLGLF